MTSYVVVIPTLATAFYFLAIASDRYVSEAQTISATEGE